MLRTRRRLRSAALVCLGVALVAGIVAAMTWPAATDPSLSDLGTLAAYAYAGLSGLGILSALALAGLAIRLDPPGASSRCTDCREPVPTALAFCPTCGRREDAPNA